MAINLRKDRDSKVFWPLTLSFWDGRVEIFDSVSHASEGELHQAFDSLAKVCKNQV
jgi:hypothetical protein